ncbi:MAG: hypothetical protein LUH10_05255 [Tannerellaceae bacterium]|nr:hypothetical protein [Tannerellaceae bacterium]
MSLQAGIFELFDKYIIFYPDEDEPDFDGVHYGGIKGTREDAPESAKKAFEEYQAELKEAEKNGIKL